MARQLARRRNDKTRTAVHGDLDQSKEQAENDFPIRHVSSEGGWGEVSFCPARSITHDNN
jgi:hypothetical protein